ncbi:MAG: type I glyceraldehyde-3-phosphate dehydrogenase, partial [Pseudomonadota bacterium]
GFFNQTLSADKDSITIGDHVVTATTERDPAKLPWRDLEVDVVFECTGFFRSPEKAGLHLEAGAKKVLISAPGKGVERTIVYGVNENTLQATDTIVSNASCTTNCLAHVAKAVHDEVGISSGLVNTIHAYTNTQRLLDAYHKDKRRGRAAATSMVPTTTGSAKAIGAVIPELDGVLDAVAVRVPTMNVSLLDFSFVPDKTLSLDLLANIFSDYKTGRKGIFDVTDEPLVSIDYNHNPHSCVVDMLQTRQQGELFKVQAWYDNEWGFSNRMLDTARAMMSAG